MRFHMLCLAFVLLSHEAEAAINSWTTPKITGASGTGTLTVYDSQAISTAIKTFVAVTDATSVTYALEQAVSPFALSTGGELTITAKLADKTSSYTLKIVATDGTTGTTGTGTATITVTVTDIDEAPKFGSLSYKKCILDNSVIDTTVITVLATDSDPGDTITHSIASGDTDDDFKIGGNTGVIQVAKTLSPSTYTLVIHAVDNESTAKTGSTTVIVTVTDDCGEKNSAAMNGLSVTSLIICMLAMLQ